MDKHWRKIDLSNLKHGVVTRIKNEVISPKWKYLIRKYIKQTRFGLNSMFLGESHSAK